MSSHMYFGRQLSRDTEHRKAMRRNLVQSLFEHGKVRTTLPKAKEVQAMAEKLITHARKGTLLARRHVISVLQDRRLVDGNQDFITEGDKTVIQKLFNSIAPKFKGRNGGYTRIIKTSDWRVGDAGSIVILQLLTEEGGEVTRKARKPAGLRKKRTEKKNAFAKKIAESAGLAAAAK